MGSGKTEYMHKYMLAEKNKKFIYVTPYLKEISDLIGEGTDENPHTEFYDKKYFREPKHLGEGKLESLHYLLVNEFNVATTHALFKMSTQETIDLIAAGEYTLVLDEAMDVVSVFNKSIYDYNMLINDCNISVGEDKSIKWINDYYMGDFEDFMRLCKNGTVAEVKKTQRARLLVWDFNIEAFNSFKEIYILTYIFEASLIKYYFDMHNVKYEKFCIQNYRLIPFAEKEPINKINIKNNINIYEGNLNNVGDKETALSLNWFKNYPSMREVLRKNMTNFFIHITEALSNDIVWTTFKSQEKFLKNKGYTKGFVPCNARSTDEYREKHYIAYCCNRYMSPDYQNYFDVSNIKLNQDAYALAELLQFIFRTAIRKNPPEPIHIYIPSARMRRLLADWLENENL